MNDKLRALPPHPQQQRPPEVLAEVHIWRANPIEGMSNPLVFKQVITGVQMYGASDRGMFTVQETGGERFLHLIPVEDILQVKLVPSALAAV